MTQIPQKNVSPTAPNLNQPFDLVLALLSDYQKSRSTGAEEPQFRCRK